MNELDKKIQSTFPEESVYKIPERYSVLASRNLPSFIKDWLIKRFTDDENGELHTEGLLQFLENHIPHKDDHIKGILVRDREPRTILARILVEPDVKTGILRFSIPDIQIKFNEGRIPPHIAKKHQGLKGGEIWGVVTLGYIPPQDKKEKGIIEITEFKPFKPYDVDLEYYRNVRKEYSIEEWVDLLIRSMEYNPEGFENLTQKLAFLSRLLVFVEARLNIIELAPKGTGKSYVFGNLSKYGWLISGGSVTRAKLFYDSARNTMGLITMYDFVAMDEIKTINFSNVEEIQGALKNYLESGMFTVAQVRQTSTSGFMLLGNISLNSELLPLHKNYFFDLPAAFQDTALLDRFHGFIEGWRLPRIRENLKVHGYTLNVEYFSEVLHALRQSSEFLALVDELVEVPRDADTRDVIAVKRCASAYLKLLFPHIQSAGDIDASTFETFCLKPALEKRRIIRQQLHLMDSEFKEEVPNIRAKKMLGVSKQ